MSSDAAPPPVEEIYGPFLMGTLLATAFYAVVCMQTFRYFVHYQRDPLFLRVLVGSVWMMNTVHEALTISTAYKQLIDGLKNPLAYLDGHPELFFKLLLTALVAVPVQGFFAYRIYIFTKRNVIVPILWFVSGAIQIVCTIIFCAKGLYMSDGTLKTVSVDRLSHFPFGFLESLTIGVAVALDILIAISMTILLAREWKSPQIPMTSRLLQRLIVFAVNTGIWSTAFALTTLILVHAFPSTVLGTITGSPVCSVYSNTLLANLNARDTLRQTRSNATGTDTFGFALSVLPETTAKPSKVSETSSSTRKEGIVSGEDVWPSAKVDPYSNASLSAASENV